MNPHTQWKVEVTTRKFADVPEGCKLLIATPTIVEDYMRKIPEGRHVTIPQMRADLAKEYGADMTCPVTSGIFVRIVAENAYEQMKQGAPLEKIAPFWRMIDLESSQARKLTFGTNFLLKQRAAEGLPEVQAKPVKATT
jgi:hypothetical protein